MKGKKGTLLIVDDEEHICSVLEQFFTRRGYRTICAGSVGSAREFVGKESIDVALIDLKLPDSSGIDIIKEIKSKSPGTKCIVMTGFASIESSIEALRLNVFDYIRKPFDLVVIGEIVDSAYEHTILLKENSAIIEKLERANRRLEKSKEQLSQKIIRANKELEKANESLKKYVARLKMLYQMGRDISSDENWSDALDRFLMALCKYLDASGSALLLFSDSERRLNVRTAFHLEEDFLNEALELLKEAHMRDSIPSEIFSLESCRSGEIRTCLEMKKSWQESVIPLLYRNRWLGFLLVRKRYRTRKAYLTDYPFINTIQTILSEEVANAVNISKLRNLKDFNETILNNINSGVLTTDKHGKVVYLNSRARDIIGSEMLGSHFDTLFPNPFGNSSLFERLIGDSKKSRSIECVLRKNEENTIPVRLSTTVVELDEYHGKTIVAIFEDLTEQKKMEEELRRADRLRSLGELSAGVAHEIRNPLTGIATTAQLLREKLADEEDKIKYLSVILDEINRLDGIIKNLLLFARPQKPNPSEGAVFSIVEAVVPLIEEKAKERGVTVRLINELDDDTCMMDSDQIKQVLLNIAINGIEACSDGGRLTISIRQAEEPSFIQIELADTGKGIPDDIGDKLYNPFFTTKSNGTGLGLSISRKIVESHGGKIYHRSKPGEGTSFFVELPRKMAVVAKADEIMKR
ncbi:MAG: hypothetical protein DRN03_05500 [Thermoplasmata archaeon]|nr:MAG: hypothetical protein DRN03_05500 [Thermoplasmata archaeon]